MAGIHFYAGIIHIGVTTRISNPDMDNYLHFSPIMSCRYSGITVFSSFDFRLRELIDPQIVALRPSQYDSLRIEDLREVMNALIDNDFLSEYHEGSITVQAQEGAWFGDVQANQLIDRISDLEFLNSLISERTDYHYRGGGMVVFIAGSPGFEEQVCLSFSPHSTRVEDLRIAVVYDGVPIDRQKLLGLADSTGFRIEPAVGWDVNSQRIHGGQIHPIRELSVGTEIQNRIVFQNKFYDNLKLARERFKSWIFYPLQTMKYWYAEVRSGIFPEEVADHYEITRFTVTDYSPFVNNWGIAVLNVDIQTDAVESFHE